MHIELNTITSNLVVPFDYYCKVFCLLFLTILECSCGVGGFSQVCPTVYFMYAFAQN